MDQKINDAALTKLRSAFSKICKAISDGVDVTDAMHAELHKILAIIPSQIATTLYSDLCRVQIACDDDSTTPDLSVLQDLLDWSNPRHVKRFQTVLIDNGSLVNKVADCVDWNQKERSARWIEEKKRASHAATAQRRKSQEQSDWSAFVVASRDENQKGYEHVRTELSNNRPPVLREWHVLILETPERLRRKDVAFWYGIRTASCTTIQKRAICHKLLQIKGFNATITNDKLNKIQQDLLCDIFRHVNHKPPHTLGTKCRRRRSFCKFICKFRWFRWRAGDERYGSST